MPRLNKIIDVCDCCKNEREQTLPLAESDPWITFKVRNGADDSRYKIQVVVCPDCSLRIYDARHETRSAEIAAEEAKAKKQPEAAT